jgi:hypothetical protein
LKRRQVCQRHFTGMVGRPEARRVTTRRDVMLWLWRAHNEVRRAGPEPGLGLSPPSHECSNATVSLLLSWLPPSPLPTAPGRRRLRLPPRAPQVNARLAKVEQEHGGSSSGDPLVPKAQWPYTRACPECRAAPGADGGGGGSSGGGGATGRVVGIEWDEEKVLAHLSEAYGGAAPDATPAPSRPGGGAGRLAAAGGGAGGAGPGALLRPAGVLLLSLAALAAALRRRPRHHGSGKLA